MAYWSAVYYSRKTYKLYQQRKKAPGCPFCDPAEISYRLQFETEHTYVIPNQTPYEIWEHHQVLDHLMVVPKRHVTGLADMTDEELLDIARVYGHYEAKGYSVYARAASNPRRSVDHLHTHLIKIAAKPLKLSLLLTKPYVMIKR